MGAPYFTLRHAEVIAPCTAKRPSYTSFRVARRTGPGRARVRELRDDRAVRAQGCQAGVYRKVRSLSERNAASQKSRRRCFLDLLYLYRIPGPALQAARLYSPLALLVPGLLPCLAHAPARRLTQPAHPAPRHLLRPQTSDPGAACAPDLAPQISRLRSRAGSDLAPAQISRLRSRGRAWRRGRCTSRA